MSRQVVGRRRTHGVSIVLILLALGVNGCSFPISNLGASDLTGKLSFPQPNVSERKPELTSPDARRTLVKPAPESVTAPTQPKQDNEIVYGDGSFVKSQLSLNRAELTPEGEVVLNFSEADIRQFAQAVLGDILGANFVVDSDVSTKITLRSNRPIAKAAVVPTVETTLAAGGLALTQDNGLYRILPIAKAKASGSAIRVPVRGTAVPGYGVTAVMLNHISPSQMAKVLEPLAPEQTILRIDDARNLLVLAAIGPEMATLLETVDMFDVDAMKGMSFGYFKIANARAPDVAKELQTVIKANAAQTGTETPQVIALDRLNALYVISSRPKTLELAQQWIERLDKGQDETQRQLFVYQLKNRKAQEVAAVVSKIFLGGSVGGEGLQAKPRDGIAPDTPITELKSRGAPRAQLAAADTVASDGDREAVSLLEPSSDSSQLNGDVRIVADQENNSLLIRATQADYKTILHAVERLDVVPPLVMIEVTIAEIALRDGLKFGIEWFMKEKSSSLTYSSLESGKILSKFPGFSYFFAAQDIAAVLNAMSEVTDVRIVSSPRVMVRDNKTATLQIGDQVPVITSTSQSVSAGDAPVIQTVQYFDTGVILKVSPQVNGGGLVTMDVNQEVSNVASKTTDGIASPTIQQRKIASSIAIQSGEAVVLGGLMREGRTKGATGIPFVSKLPGVGELFQTQDNETERTELLVIITPRVVWGRSDAREVTDELRQKMENVVRNQNTIATSQLGSWQPKK